MSRFGFIRLARLLIGFEPGIKSLWWYCKVCKVSSFSLSSFYDRVFLIAGLHRGATWCLRRRYGTQGGWVAQSERPPAHGLHRHRWDGSIHATWQGLHFGWCCRAAEEPAIKNHTIVERRTRKLLTLRTLHARYTGFEPDKRRSRRIKPYPDTPPRF